MKKHLWRVASVVMALSISLLGTARAADWYVATNGNNASNGLTWASAWKSVVYASTASGVSNYDTINIGPGTFTETISGNPGVCVSFNKNITFKGAGKTNTIVQGQVSPFSGVAHRVFYPSGVSNACIRDLTIRNGDEPATYSGAAIYANNDCLLLLNLRFDSNRGDNGVVRITNTAIGQTFQVIGCDFVSNQVVGTSTVTVPGGLYIDQSVTIPVVVSNCTFVANTGKSGAVGLYSSVNKVAFFDTTFSSNVASIAGGAINAYAPYNVLESGCTFAGNTATNGNGGAIYYVGTNTFASSRTQQVVNCTFYGNQAVNHGGAVSIESAVSVLGTLGFFNCTIFSNGVTSASGTGGGIYNTAATNLGFESTIVAGNSAPTKPDFDHTVFTGEIGRVTNCVIGINNGCAALCPTGLPNTSLSFVGTNSAPVDPQLGVLTTNGGRTMTCALLSKSAWEVSHGSNPLGLNNDQRGPGYPRLAGAAVDIGAVEFTPGVSKGSVVMFR